MAWVTCRAGHFPTTLPTNLAQSSEKLKKEIQGDLELLQVRLLAQANSQPAGRQQVHELLLPDPL